MGILKYHLDQTPIFSENQKIKLVQSGVTDPYLSTITIKGLVNSQRYQYDTFEKVKAKLRLTHVPISRLNAAETLSVEESCWAF
jgi:hypothetical protein